MCPPVTIDENLDLVGMLDAATVDGTGDAVPAGMYGREALDHARLLDAVAPHVAQSDNVRSALAFVALGEAPLGIVYASDARVEDSVQRHRDFSRGQPHADHAARRDHGTKRASRARRTSLDFLSSDIVAPIWREYGFSVCRLMLGRRITTWLGPDEWQAVRLSCGFSVLGATLVSLPLGILRFAYALARVGSFNGKQVLNGLVHMPLILPRW